MNFIKLPKRFLWSFQARDKISWLTIAKAVYRKISKENWKTMMISRRYVKSCLGKIYLMVLGFVLHDKSITGIRAKRIQFELGVLIVFYLLYVLVNYFQLNIIAPIHISERFDYQFFDIKLSIFLPLLMMIILYVVIASHVYKLLLKLRRCVSACEPWKINIYGYKNSTGRARLV